jgi:hypothetical protein
MGWALRIFNMSRKGNEDVESIEDTGYWATWLFRYFIEVEDDKRMGLVASSELVIYEVRSTIQ